MYLEQAAQDYMSIESESAENRQRPTSRLLGDILMRCNDSLECIPWPRRKSLFLNVMCVGAVIRALVEGHLPQVLSLPRSHNLGS